MDKHHYGEGQHASEVYNYVAHCTHGNVTVCKPCGREQTLIADCGFVEVKRGGSVGFITVGSPLSRFLIPEKRVFNAVS